MKDQVEVPGATNENIETGDRVVRFGVFGAAMAILHCHASSGPEGASGSYSNSAIALPQQTPPSTPATEQEKAVKIARAMRSGPAEITRDATVAEMDLQGRMTVLREGTNGWICTPGDENKVGDPPMCADKPGMQWMMDALAGKPAPTNPAPGLCYMLCGATQHSSTSPYDRTSPAVPIGPHWMVLWPFDAKNSGLPTTVRDAGAWIMFPGTPYAYLHICGTPWDGNEYSAGDEPRWTMRYVKSRTAHP